MQAESVKNRLTAFGVFCLITPDNCERKRDFIMWLVASQRCPHQHTSNIFLLFCQGVLLKSMIYNLYKVCFLNMVLIVIIRYVLEELERVKESKIDHV